MTQHSFDFTPPPKENAKEIQNWVDQHNHQVMGAAQTTSASLGSLLSALNGSEAKANAVYLIRGVLGQILRKNSGPGAHVFRRGFMLALRAEIKMKKSSQDPALALRDVLIKGQASR
jgi:hypothetical protein